MSEAFFICYQFPKTKFIRKFLFALLSAAYSDFCSQEGRNVHKREWTKGNRIMNAENDVQNLYTQLYNNTNNQKRKLMRCPDRLEQYNVLFNELKEKALAIKRGLSDDSLTSEIMAFSVQLLDWKRNLGI